MIAAARRAKNEELYDAGQFLAKPKTEQPGGNPTKANECR
jgi:hypothetical protein